jgi:hypothetical protein
MHFAAARSTLKQNAQHAEAKTQHIDKVAEHFASRAPSTLR